MSVHVREAVALAIASGPPPEATGVAAAIVACGGVALVDARGLVVAASAETLARVRETLTTPAARATLDDVARAIAADGLARETLRLGRFTLDLASRARVMGILNVTPDSFFDGGAYRGIERARARAADMVALGADVIDVGGQSYAASSPRVAAEEERARVVPVVEALVRDGLGVPISVDTVRPAVADAALAAGADAVNDCSGLADPSLAAIVARYDAGLVVVHLRGELNVRAASYRYDDALGEISEFLRERLAVARAAGVAADGLVADPGLEFGKETATDLEILNRFAELRGLGVPLLFAASRKSFIGRVFGRPADELLVPSLATAAVGIRAGARLVRVHDVAETVAVATMLAAIAETGRAAISIVEA